MIKDKDNIILKIKNKNNQHYKYYYLEHFKNTIQLSLYKNGPNKLFKFEKNTKGFHIKVPHTQKYVFVTQTNKVELSNNKTLFQN